MSKLEEEMLRLINEASLPAPVQEYKAIEGRRFRWDFAWPDARILLEVQGGTWMARGGHNSGSGVSRDCEKANLANLDGWNCLAVTRDHIKSGEAIQWVTTALNRFPPFQ